jgi:hypothetical protein
MQLKNNIKIRFVEIGWTALIGFMWLSMEPGGVRL